uniref:Secreted protein n=1 Tax=Picea glauca TaxID=3330 RepID=A0A101M3B4_PICGL|nr:hypothetical protein ABT39_MTgene17 [Picea glauca]
MRSSIPLRVIASLPLSFVASCQLYDPSDCQSRTATCTWWDLSFAHMGFPSSSPHAFASVGPLHPLLCIALTL